MITLEITGADEVAAKFGKRAAMVVPALQRVMAKVALLVERQGKLYSPVDTGRMRASIYPVTISTTETDVGPKTSYAKYVHARVPFMFAAREDAIPQVGQFLSDEVNKITN